MGRITFSWRDWMQEAGVVLTVDSEMASLPGAHLLDTIVAKAWRTSAVTSAAISVDLGAAREIGVVVLAGLSIAATDTVRLRLGSTAGAGDLLDTTATASDVAEGYGLWCHVLSTPITARYATIDLDAPSLATDPGYLQVGRLFIGSTWTPGHNFRYGAQETRVDESRITVAPLSGAEYVDPGVSYRTLAVTLDGLNETEAKDQLRDLDRRAGIRNQIVVIPDPDSSRLASEVILGRMTRLDPLLHVRAGWWTRSLTIKESL